jgi:F420H(2)-dependent quinone reductase
VSPGLQHALTRVHVLVLRASRGRIGGRIWGLGILLLTTTGRRTGRPQTTPLCYLADGDALVVVASNGGAARHPAWWLNLSHAPQAMVEVGGVRQTVHAREATPEERERLWAAITSIAPGYLRYQARTIRKIPLGILERD